MVERHADVLEPGDGAHIPPGLRHRMEALEDSDVLEVSTPELDDVVRLEDRYGRVASDEPAEARRARPRRMPGSADG